VPNDGGGAELAMRVWGEHMGMHQGAVPHMPQLVTERVWGAKLRARGGTVQHCTHVCSGHMQAHAHYDWEAYSAGVCTHVHALGLGGLQCGYDAEV
jgi:hypothetical protein